MARNHVFGPQPLTAMNNYLNVAQRLFSAGNHEAGLAVLARLAEQSDRARQIIRRLRDLVQRRETTRQVESLAPIIEETSGLALLGSGPAVKLDIRVAQDAAEAVIDKVQIQQVLLNLMRNAIEAMEGLERRELTITTSRAGERVAIHVADSGSGLPDQVRTRLFQPFVTSKPDGMGVGLSVCRAIVDAHGGELYAEDREDGGTIFSLTLPRL